MRTRIVPMLVATLGTLALAATPLTIARAAATQFVTRAEYVQQLMQAVGVPQMPNAAQTFRDVPPGSRYFGWVEAAYHAGITTGIAPGVFGPNQDLNRAEAAAFDLRAYSPRVANWATQDFGLNTQGQFGDIYQCGTAPGCGESQGFSDDSAIPKALVSDVGLATTIGLLHGFPDGTFGPLDNLTMAQSQDLIAQLKAVITADGSGIQWRFFSIDAPSNGDPSGSSVIANERAVAYSADLEAGIVEGQEFSTVQQYVDPADLTQVQQAYNQIQAQFQSKDVPAGIAWRIVGVAFSLGWSPELVIQSYSTTTGQSVVVSQPLQSPDYLGQPAPSFADVSIGFGVTSDLATGLVTGFWTDRWGLSTYPQASGWINGFNPVLHPIQAVDRNRIQTWGGLAYEAINAGGN